MLMPDTVNLAVYLLVDRAPNARRPARTSVRWAIALLTFTAVVFRAEVVMFLAPLALFLLLNDRSTFSDILRVGVTSGIASVGTSGMAFFAKVS